MFKDNTQFRERFNRWKNGELVYDKGRPIDPPEVELPTVVVTPDYEYNLYLGTLPANQRLADESEYRQHRYWELNGKPKNFKDAVSKRMFKFDKKDNLWHAGSVAWNDSIKGYEFMKPKTHPTTNKELEVYNSNGFAGFRQSFKLEDNPNLDYYRYLPRYPLYRKGKDDDPPIDVGVLPTVNVIAPRTKWSKGYGDDGNPIYTSNYKESDEYLNNFLPKGEAEKKRERWYTQNVGSNGQPRPGLHGDAAEIAKWAEIGIGGALAPLALATIAGPLAGSAVGGVNLLADSFAGTPLQILGAKALTNPYVDAALTSLGGAHAAQSIVNGEADAMTALELLPMTRVIKPAYRTAKAFVGRAAERAVEAVNESRIPWVSSIPENENMAYRRMGPLERDWLLEGNELSTRDTNPLTEIERKAAESSKNYNITTRSGRKFNFFKAGAEHGGRKQFAKGLRWRGTTVTHGKEQVLAIPGKNLPWVSGRHYSGPQGYGHKVGQISFEEAPFGSHIDLQADEEGFTGINPSALDGSIIYSPIDLFGHNFGYRTYNLNKK